MPFPTCPTIEDFLDLPSHKITHDGIKGVVDAHTAVLGDNVGLLAGHATLEARVLVQATSTVLSTVRGSATVGRAVFETDTGAVARRVDPVVYGGTGAAFWRYEASPKLVIDHPNGRVGVNVDAPLIPLHVQSVGGATGLAAHGAEVARFSRLAGAGTHSIVSIIADRAGHSRLYLGDQDSLSSGEIRQDHTDNSLRFYSGDLQHMSMMGDGATIISRDSTTGLGPVLEGQTVLRLIRAHEPAAGAIFELVSGDAASATIRLGDAANVADGRIRYNNATREMQLYAADTLAVEISPSGRCHILRDGAGVGTGYHGGAGLVVARAVGASFVQVVSQGLFASGLLLGTTATPELAKLSYDAADRTVLLNIEGNKILKTTWNGATELRGGGATSGGIDIDLVGGVTTAETYTGTNAGAANVVILAGGLLRRSTSTLEGKQAVTPLDYETSEAFIRGINPITFRPVEGNGYTGREYIGFAAEEIAALDERAGDYERAAEYLYDEDTDDDTGEVTKTWNGKYGPSLWDDPKARNVENYDQRAILAMTAQVVQHHHGELADLADLSLAHLTAIAQLAERVTALEAV